MLLLGKGTGPLGRSVRLMWIYEKRLQYPVKITKTCPKTAQLMEALDFAAAKAQELGIDILDEQGFLALLDRSERGT